MIALTRYALKPHRPLVTSTTDDVACKTKSKGKGKGFVAAAPQYPHFDNNLLWRSCDAFAAAFMDAQKNVFGRPVVSDDLAPRWLELTLGLSGAALRSWPHRVATAVLMHYNALRVSVHRDALRSKTPVSCCFFSDGVKTALPALVALAARVPTAAKGTLSATLALRYHKEYVFVLLQLLGQLNFEVFDCKCNPYMQLREEMGAWPGMSDAVALSLQVVSGAADGGALLSALSFLGTLLPLQPCPLKPADTAKVVALLQKLLPRTVEDIMAVAVAGEHDMCSALYWMLRQLIVAEHKDAPALLRGRAEVLSLLPSAANTPPRSLSSLYARTLCAFFDADFYADPVKTTIAEEIEPVAQVAAASAGSMSSRARKQVERLVATAAQYKSGAFTFGGSATKPRAAPSTEISFG